MKFFAHLAVLAASSCQTVALRKFPPLNFRASFSTHLKGRASASDVLKREAEKSLIADGYR